MLVLRKKVKELLITQGQGTEQLTFEVEATLMVPSVACSTRHEVLLAQLQTRALCRTTQRRRKEEAGEQISTSLDAWFDWSFSFICIIRI